MRGLFSNYGLEVHLYWSARIKNGHFIQASPLGVDKFLAPQGASIENFICSNGESTTVRRKEMLIVYLLERKLLLFKHPSPIDRC